MTIKQPRRVYSDDKVRHEHPRVWHIWENLIKKHDAKVLKNGENPQDYPEQAVAYETLNFGWILSKPGSDGFRKVLEQF